MSEAPPTAQSFLSTNHQFENFHFHDISTVLFFIFLLMNQTLLSNHLEEIFSYENVERFTYIFLIPLVCIPGIIAATLSAIVFAKLRQNSLEVLLCGLSLFDVILLTSSIMIYPSMHQCRRNTEEEQRQNSFVCHFFWRSTVSVFPVSLIAQAGSVWTYVAVTVDRFIAVSFPIKKRVWSTRSTSTTVLIMITIVSAFFKLPSFFEVRLNSKGEVEPTELRNDEFYIEFYLFYLYVAFIQIIPWTIIIFLNSIIIHKVRKAYRIQQSMIQNCKNQNRKSKREDAERKVTVMATVMTGIFVICNIPPSINYLIDRYSQTSFYRQRIPLSNLLVCVNRFFSASNMMIYCFFNCRFRQAAINLLRCKKIKNKKRGENIIGKSTKDDINPSTRPKYNSLRISKLPTKL